MYHIFFIHSSVEGHLGCFQFSAIMNRASVNFGEQVSLHKTFGYVSILVRITIVVKKHYDQNKLESKSFIWFILLHCSLSLKEVRRGTQTQAQLPPGYKISCRGYGGVLLTGLLPWLVQPAFS